jgi:hypothetical protein
MVRLFVRHPVRDYAAWRQAYDDFDQERRSMGVVGHAVVRTLIARVGSDHAEIEIVPEALGGLLRPAFEPTPPRRTLH